MEKLCSDLAREKAQAVARGKVEALSTFYAEHLKVSGEKQAMKMVNIPELFDKKPTPNSTNFNKLQEAIGKYKKACYEKKYTSIRKKEYEFMLNDLKAEVVRDEYNKSEQKMSFEEFANKNADLIKRIETSLPFTVELYNTATKKEKKYDKILKKLLSQYKLTATELSEAKSELGKRAFFDDA
jgi:hypothetical protein